MLAIGGMEINRKFVKTVTDDNWICCL